MTVGGIVRFECWHLPSPNVMWSPRLCVVLTRGSIDDAAAYWGIHLSSPALQPDERSIAEWVAREGHKIPEPIARAIFDIPPEIEYRR